MNLVALAAAWTATQPLRKKIGEKSKGFFEWMCEHWKELILAGLAIFLLTVGGKALYQKGRTDSDAIWIAKYNETVTEFNDRLELLRSSSTVVADEVTNSSEKVVTDLDKIQAGLDHKALTQETAKCIDGDKATLNTPLPKELFKAWADMNAAGAQHNPYKDTPVGKEK